MLYEFDFPKSVGDGSSVLRNFMGDNTTTILCLFEYVDIIIAHSSEEGSTTNGSRTSTNDGDGFFIRRR